MKEYTCTCTYCVCVFIVCSEVSGLIQQVNRLQSETDTLDEINEALRDKLGLEPGAEPELTQVMYMYMYQEL